MTTKEKIIELRLKGYSYNRIKIELNCSKGVISYHCKNSNLCDIGLNKIPIDKKLKDEIISFYETHTQEETLIKFTITIFVLKNIIKEYNFHKKNFILKKDTTIKNYRNKQKIKAIEYKGGSCEICGYSACIYALEFHHKDPTKKDFGISKEYRKWETIKDELDKCVLLCANCHREEHMRILEK